MFRRCGNSNCEFPKSIFFILGNEFCERFSYYGMRAVLILYLTEDVLYPRSEAKFIFHVVTFLNYFMPLFGALLADMYIGKFKTIWTVSIIYTLGQILLSVSSIHLLSFPRLEICIVALVIISIGSGGIKPCVSAFGGDQFDPSQYTARDRFYSIFYVFINTGALLSMIISPMFRANVYCFGKGNCYPLAFGFPALLMVIATIIFVCGHRLYKINPAQGNAVVDVSKCIVHAIKRRVHTKEKRDHWLDYADDRFDTTTINDVKTALSVLVMFLPIPVFWALFDQQGSAWTLQSSQMDGRTSFVGEVKPDQMDASNALLVMILVPVFSYGVYPLLAKFGLLTKPLQRMATGMLLAAVAFTVAAFVYISIETRLVAPPADGQTEVVLHNALPCNIKIQLHPHAELSTSLEKYTSTIIKEINIEAEHSLDGSVIINDNKCSLTNGSRHNFTINVKSGVAYGALFELDNEGKFLTQQANESRARDAQTHKPQVRFVRVPNDKTTEDSILLFKAASGRECADLRNPFSASKYTLVRSNTEFVFCFAKREGFEDSDDADKRKCPEECSSGEIGSRTFDKGGIFTTILSGNGTTITWDVINTGRPDSISMFNQIPQYFILTCGEVMLSITALSFAYAEAPESLKSIFQAAWLLTIAFGNVIVLVVDAIKSASGVQRESISFFVYAVLMVLDMLLFVVLARRYKYRSKFSEEQTKM